MYQNDHFEHTWMFAEQPACFCGHHQLVAPTFKRRTYLRVITRLAKMKFQSIRKRANKPKS